ncbi:MAG: hypothetical protein OP8BY_0545 [Candidatus Saccharicenans subterraneus]|uniref:Uncharacterized protein n=1 Tax=Candidatus Saccharicenans subterraneus TaxID=2508984 RepID=A0A3E2BKH9_9BACT|nr:MAG: hypothetical protein OP8BY_0545 [Candidatus Saccharicenans subterraneum]
MGIEGMREEGLELFSRGLFFPAGRSCGFLFKWRGKKSPGRMKVKEKENVG